MLFITPTFAFISIKEKSNKALVKQLYNKGAIAMLGKPFKLSMKSEINSLIARSVFKFVTFNPAKYNGYIFKSRIINKVKGKDINKPYKKSCLVI